MRETVRLFVGFDPSEAAAYHVFCQSVIELASVPVAFIPLHRPMLAGFDGKRTGSNAFVYSRYLIPWLCHYTGWAIFADGDMLCRRDIAELWDLRASRYAVQVVQHDYLTRHRRKYTGTPLECDNEDYPRKNWSSLVLWNCEAHKTLTRDVVQEAHSAWLARFEWLPTAEERDDVMRRFRAGEVQVRVATTVIEVGIDVPNATLMVIEHPERFGLAQLHQLRGRVGRGAGESHCILLAPGHAPPRLKAFAATEDGFRIAEVDLLERKQGDLLGQRQSGSEEIRLARFPDDADLLEQARALARRILDIDPALEKKEHAVLRARTLSRYPRGEVLFRIG